MKRRRCVDWLVASFLTSLAEFHNDIELLGVLKGVVQLDYERGVDLLEDNPLGASLADLRLALYVILLKYLHGEDRV